MMPDIIPYGEEEALKLGKCLSKMGVPSVGPGTCMALLRIASGIDEKLKQAKDYDPQVRTLLNNYRARILDICAVEAGAQAEILQQLENIILKK